jgi:ParB/RepB/Spo0J family partition protein
MVIERIDLDLIEDNPFQSRLTYHRKDIDDLAASIKVNGLLQIPPARRKDGKLQLAFGHLRKRAFVKLAKEDSQYEQMPLEIRLLTDEKMALFALEENIKRSDITPIEVARAVDKYLESFTDKTELNLAEMLNMTQGNISNMRRVLRLPAQVLEKIEEGKINFTMGRELLILQGLSAGKTNEWSQKDKKSVDIPIDGEYMMLEAIGKIESSGGRGYGAFPVTVDGIQKAIHAVACNRLRALDKEYTDSGYNRRNQILFDAKAQGCFECNKMIKTHPTKSGLARWCTDIPCWEEKQKEHTEAAAAAARKKMQDDVFKTVVKAEKERPGNISQEISGAAETNEVFTTVNKSLTAENETEVTEVKTDLTDETPGRRGPSHKLCLGCMNRSHCDGTGVYAVDKEGGGDELACDDRMTKENMQEIKQKATLEIPAELRDMAMEKAGTRAEVLDIRELRIGNWGDELKQGYALLNGEHRSLLECIDDPEECVKRCTHGFHYGFNSEAKHGYESDKKKEPVKFVCTDTKCLAKKKGDFTRAKYAAGAARKRAELAAVKQAVELTTDILDRPRMKLIILGICSERGYYGDKTAVNFFAGRFNIKTKENGGCSISEDKLKPAIIEAVDKLTIREIAQLIVDYMLRRLMDDGDIVDYRVQLTKPLKWLGIGINVDYKEGK